MSVNCEFNTRGVYVWTNSEAITVAYLLNSGLLFWIVTACDVSHNIWWSNKVVFKV